MTKFASPGLFLSPPEPVDQYLLSSREMLLSTDGFLGFFQAIPHPAALLSTSYQLVLANPRMISWLGWDSDGGLVGATLGDLGPRPGGPSHRARTQFVEIQGRGFFVLTMEFISDCRA